MLCRQTRYLGEVGFRSTTLSPALVIREKTPEIILGGLPVVDLPVPSLGWLALWLAIVKARNGRSLGAANPDDRSFRARSEI